MVKRVVLNRITDISGQNNFNIEWEQSELDIGGWWNPANPTIVTVPTGVHYARVSSNIPAVRNIYNYYRLNLQVRKNGSVWGPGVSHWKGCEIEINAYTNNNKSFASPFIKVQPGDQLSLFYYDSLSGDIEGTTSDTTGFCLEVEGLSSDEYAGALVGFSSMEEAHSNNPTYFNTLNGNKGSEDVTIINWEKQYHDTNNIWNPDTPSRLIVPEGSEASHARLRLTIDNALYDVVNDVYDNGINHATEGTTLQIIKNSSDIVGFFKMGHEGLNTIRRKHTEWIQTGLLPIRDGDYFEAGYATLIGYSGTNFTIGTYGRHILNNFGTSFEMQLYR